MKFRINNLTFIGVIIIAFGTYLIYLGAKEDNDKSQNQVTQKLDSFSKKLDSTRGSILTPIEKQKQIDTIKTQFDNWAKTIKENYAEMELSREKRLITQKEREIAGNIKWAALLNKTFDNFQGMVSSINRQFPKNKITAYQNNDKNYQILQFSNHVFLRVSYNKFGVKNEFPSFDLDLYNNLQDAQQNLRSINAISIDIRSENEVNVNKEGVFRQFLLNPDKFDYSISDLDNIFKEIITYQFMLSNKELQQ